MSADVPFGRLLNAMATAFHEDGSVDLDGTGGGSTYISPLARSGSTQSSVPEHRFASAAPTATAPAKARRRRG